MFKQLVIKILALGGYNQTAAAGPLGYKTINALQSVITKQDLKLTVLANICKLCKFDLVITDHAGITISVLDYINQQQQNK